MYTSSAEEANERTAKQPLSIVSRKVPSPTKVFWRTRETSHLPARRARDSGEGGEENKYTRKERAWSAQDGSLDTHCRNSDRVQHKQARANNFAWLLCSSSRQRDKLPTENVVSALYPYIIFLSALERSDVCVLANKRRTPPAGRAFCAVRVVR